MMGDDELDRLLSAPLSTVEDNGFSRAVAKTIADQERNDAWIEWGMVAAACALFVVFVPVGDVARQLTGASIDLSKSVPFAIGCAALALTHTAVRVWAD
jgi:hypothetical protein